MAIWLKTAGDRSADGCHLSLQLFLLKARDTAKTSGFGFSFASCFVQQREASVNNVVLAKSEIQEATSTSVFFLDLWPTL